MGNSRPTSEPEVTQAIAVGKDRAAHGSEHGLHDLHATSGESIVPVPPRTGDINQSNSYHTLPERPGKYPNIPGFEVLGELGRGGMGVVYRVKQLKLNRVVALKMLLHADEANASDMARFRSEAEAVASIKHPNVVHVHEFGTLDDKPYFTMEYLAGGTLHHRIRQQAPFEISYAVTLLEKLARAIHAAHMQGIVHRDLKPANVLFDTNGEPRVTDFGLAKRLSQNLTVTQSVMGTPTYMPPEQAAGQAKQVGPPADIYALGVILYECLMGRPPFESKDSMNLLNQVIHGDPPAMRSRLVKVPRDLELICMKCLEKDPADRYKTAADFAEDLRRFRDREPVSVRPAGMLERTLKWARRRPTMAAVYGLTILTVVFAGLAGGAAALWLIASRAKDEANLQAQKAREAKRDTETALNELAEKTARLDHLNKVKDQALEGEKAAVSNLEAERRRTQQIHYFHCVAMARKELDGRNFQRAIQLLEDCPPKLRGWEWWHTYRAANPDCGSGTTTKSMPSDITFDPTNKNIITALYNGNVMRFDFNKEIGTAQTVHEAGMSQMLLSDDGRRVLTIRPDDQPDAIAVWDLQTGKKLVAWPGSNDLLLTSGFSGDGNRVVVGYEGAPLRTFDVSRNMELSASPDPVTTVYNMKLSRDGSVSIVVNGPKVHLWNAVEGKRIRTVSAPARPVSASVLHPALTSFALGSIGGEIVIHPAAESSAVPSAIPRAHRGEIYALTYSKDGKLLASAGEDGAVRVWDVEKRTLFREYFGHVKAVSALKFNDTSEYLASCDIGFLFRIWPLASNNDTRRVLDISQSGAMPDGNYVANSTVNRFFSISSQEARVWLPLRKISYPFPYPQGVRYTTAAIHPDKEEVLVGLPNGDIALWRKLPSTGSIIKMFDDPIVRIEYSATGDRALIATQKQVAVIETNTMSVKYHSDAVIDTDAVAISPDGKRVISAGGFYYTIHNIEDRSTISNMLLEKISAVSFTPDSQLAIVGTRAWQVHYFEFKPKSMPLRSFHGHTTAIRSIGFNTDGTRLAAGAEDGTIALWDTATGTLAIQLDTRRAAPVTRLHYLDGVWFAMQPNMPPMLFDGKPGRLALKRPTPVFKD